jgi:Tfp pilus assembly protein PilN
MRAVNLIPSDDRRGAGGLAGIGSGQSQGAAFGVLALLAGLALLALVYGLARHQVSSRRTQLAAVQAKVNSVQQSTTSLSSYTSFIALREQRIQAVDTLVDSRFDWAHAMHELGRVMPSGASITSLDGTIAGTTPLAAATSPAASASAATSTTSTATPAASTTASGSTGAGAAVTSATPPGSVPTMTLSGCAKSQATVALMLQRLRLIDGASKVALQSSAKSTSAGASAGSVATGSCSGPTFSATLTFEPLPTAPAATGGAELTSTTGAGQ